MIRIQDLAGLNQRLGGQRTDSLLETMAKMMRTAQKLYAEQESILARLRGGEFALLCPGMAEKEAHTLVVALSHNLESLALTGEIDSSPVAALGMVPFKHGDSLKSLLIQGDHALTRAESSPLHHAPLAENEANSPAEADRHLWFNRLDTLLSEERLQLFFQPVCRCAPPGDVLHHKVLARINDEQGNSIAAGFFLPWIQRFGWNARLDQVMVKQTLDYLSRNSGTLALSLSGSTVLDLNLLTQMLAPLKGHPERARRVILELDENQLPETHHLEALIALIAEYGCQLGLQHFGGRFNLIGNLAQWGLAYLKIDGSYIRNIDRENDKKVFIEALYRTANSIDLPLIAERVETEGELNTLRGMGLQGAMGRLLGEPFPAPDNTLLLK